MEKIRDLIIIKVRAVATYRGGERAKMGNGVPASVLRRGFWNAGSSRSFDLGGE